MLPEFPSAARISEYVCHLEYLVSRMNVGSYGPTEPHLWLLGKVPPRTWDDCRSTSERKQRTHRYDDLVDLLIELALERKNDSHMEKFHKRYMGKGASPTHVDRSDRIGHSSLIQTDSNVIQGRCLN